MKKYNKMLFLLIIMILSFLLMIDNKKTLAAGENALSAYAYELKLVRYRGAGNSVEYLNVAPILIYHPDIMNDITNYQLTGAGNIPSSYEDFYSGNSYDIAPASYLDNFTSNFINAFTSGQDGTTTQETGITVGNQEVLGQGANFGEPSVPTTGDNTVYADLGITTVGSQSYLYTNKDDTEYGPQENKDPASGDSGYLIKTYVYYTKAMKVSYPGSMIQMKYYQRKIPDSNLTAASVEGGYVNTLLKTYGGTKQRIKDYFGYDVQDWEYPFIYVEAVPVHRVIEKNTGSLTRTGTYTVKTIEHIYEYEKHWTADDWYKDGLKCSDPSYSISSSGRCYSTWGREVDTYYDCDGTVYTCKTYRTNCWCSTNYDHGAAVQLWSLKVSPGKKLYYIMLGSLMKGPSYLKTSLETGEYLERAVNLCSNSYHAKTGTSSADESGYYIGPNKQDALVGTTSVNPYILSGGCSSLSATTGRQHIWLEGSEPGINPTRPCQTACSATLSSKGNKSDEYLQCAENYCDAWVDKDLDNINSRNNKRDCMLVNCGYVYGETKTGREKDRQSVNSCANSSSPYTSSVRDLTSSCNKDNSSGNKVSNLTGVTVEDCVGDVVKDFDRNAAGILNDSPEITVFDQRTYINKICSEEVNFEFKDLKDEDLSVGTGFTYPIVENGNRKCTYFFNLEQWKFDYASVPSRQPLKRKRLLYILEQFNQTTKTENKTKNYYDSAFVAEYDDDVNTFGDTNYKVEGFDFSNSTVTVDIKEKLVDDSIATPTNQVLEITEAKDGMKTNPAINVKKTGDVVKIIENNSIKSDTAMQFESTAPGTVKYGLQKVCVSNDGNATVSVAPGNGICGSNSDGTIYAENKHYTSFKIKLDNDNPVNTKVSVVSSDKHKTTYYSANETCTYSVGSTDTGGGDEASCKLFMDISSGTKISSKEAYASSANISLKYDVPTSPTSVAIIDKIVDGISSTKTTRTDGESATVTRSSNRADEVHELTGEVTYKDYKGNSQTVTCNLDIDLKEIGGTCGLKCEIVKINDKNYAIKSIGSTSPTYWSYYVNTKAKFKLNYKFATKVVPSGTIDGKQASYIALSSALSSEDILVGYIRTNNENCNALCSYGTGKTKQDCSKLFLPTERDDIYDYCTNPDNLENDINDYVDSNDCIKSCSTYNMCQNDKCDKNKATSHCGNDNWEKYGFTSEASCMHYCYRDCSVPQGDTYLFRTVNITNPFPESQESNYPYEKGKRIVGANWNQLSGFITYDEEDSTTITGPNANAQVEYIIDLTPEDIRRIRQDTESSGLNNAKRTRAVYVKLDRVKTGSNTIKEYKSNFLHNSQFVGIFRSNHGSTISTFTP